jgi:hypothetical protein
MKNVYLVLAVLGTVLPYWFFGPYFASAGLSVAGFLTLAFDNPVAAGLSADVVVSSAVFWAWLFANQDGSRGWYLIPLNLLIGLSCALPLYLYLRCRDAEGSPAAALASR